MESNDYIILKNLSFKKNFSNDIIEPNFLMLIVGKPGSGKSTLLSEILVNPKLLNKKFDYLLIFSPTPLKDLGLDKEDEEEIFHQEFDLDFLFKKISQINSQTANSTKSIEFLIVFDDMIGKIKEFQKNPQMMNLIFNRRHLLNNGCISIILISQRYMTIPCYFRSTTTLLLFFKLNKKEYDSIISEHLNWIEDKSILNIRNDFDFLFINLSKGIYYKNFLKS